MHLGNAWTALWAWLQVRRHNGSLVLRMEDLDLARCKPAYAETIPADLRWLGLDWDEGPGVGGPHAPYVQSERVHRYEQVFQQLVHSGWLYPCFCTRSERLAIASAPHADGDSAPVRCACRDLDEAKRTERARDKTPSWRLRIPDETIRFHDIHAGVQTVAARFLPDVVIKRSDGIIGYQLAVVVDDAEMDISHVLRGADLLTSAAIQTVLFKALHRTVPRFAHVPLLCDENGRRLAKRHEDASLAALRHAGVPAQRVLGVFAHLAGLQAQPDPVDARDLLNHTGPRFSSMAPIRIPSEWLYRVLYEGDTRPCPTRTEVESTGRPNE